MSCPKGMAPQNRFFCWHVAEGQSHVGSSSAHAANKFLHVTLEKRNSHQHKVVIYIERPPKGSQRDLSSYEQTSKLPKHASVTT